MDVIIQGGNQVWLRTVSRGVVGNSHCGSVGKEPGIDTAVARVAAVRGFFSFCFVFFFSSFLFMDTPVASGLGVESELQAYATAMLDPSCI